MKCIHCGDIMTSLEISLFKDECDKCVGDYDIVFAEEKVRDDDVSYLTIPNHGGPICFDTSDVNKTKVVTETKQESEDSWYAIGDGSEYVKLDGAYTQEVMDAFKDKDSLGVVQPLSHRDTHVGSSDYSKRTIQPWDIWREYKLNPWEADIVKRILRTKRQSGMTERESRLEDLHKIKHICDELIAQERGDYDD